MDYARVAGWTKQSRLPGGKSSLFDMQKLFIPINQGNVHWVLVVVDMNGSAGAAGAGAGSSTKMVSFFDSFGRDGTTYVEVSFPLPLPHQRLGHKGAHLPLRAVDGRSSSCVVEQPYLHSFCTMYRERGLFLTQVSFILTLLLEGSRARPVVPRDHARRPPPRRPLKFRERNSFLFPLLVLIF